jgi:hypothetical protein
MRTSFPDSEGWPRPLRAPQHAAAPFTLSAHARQQWRRALRLFVAAGTCAAGLCLVIGAIVLVISAVGPSKAAPVAATSAAGARAAKAGPPAHRPDRVIAAFAGYGDRTSRSFRVDKAAAWQIQWSYRCPANRHAGLLVVGVADPGAAGAAISQNGTGGRGVTSVSRDGPAHQLVVISSCSWTMKVSQRE